MLYISKVFRQNWVELEDGLLDICKVFPKNIAMGFLRKGFAWCVDMLRLSIVFCARVMQKESELRSKGGTVDIS